MVRDSKGRFAKANKESDLIRRMDLNLNKKGGREVPVVDKRRAGENYPQVLTVPIPIAKFEESENGRIYKLDEKLINTAIKNLNRLGLGSLDHPVKKESLFAKVNAEITKRGKKSEDELLKAIYNINGGKETVEVNDSFGKPVDHIDKTRNTLFSETKPISVYGNNFGNVHMFGNPIVEFNRSYAISFTDDYFLRINFSGTKYPNMIEFYNKLKSFDYFTVNFMWYDREGYQAGLKTFDGYKFLDLTYNSEKDIYTLTLKKNNAQ